MYYVVREGKELGIYNSLQSIFKIHENWNKKIDIRSYETLKEARQSVKNTSISPKVKKSKKEVFLSLYVDGSHNQTRKVYGIGILLEKNNVVLYEDYLTVEAQEKKILLHEWYAFLEGIKVLNSFSYTRCTIYTDSTNIYEAFNSKCPNLNKTAQTIYQQCKSLFNAKAMKVEFLKSHQGNVYNERVDVLAKCGAGVRKLENQPKPKLQYFDSHICLKKTKPNIDNSPFVTDLSLDNSKTYPYIKEKIELLEFDLNNQWIPWDEFCRKLQIELQKDNKKMKLKKLKKYKPFNEDFEVLHIGQTLSIKKMKPHIQ